MLLYAIRRGFGLLERSRLSAGRAARAAAVGFIAAVVLVLAGSLPSASAGVPSTVWGQSCAGQPNADDIFIFRMQRCIAGAKLATRGIFLKNPACLMLPPVPGWIYPSTTFCGGRGAEAIEQSRVIAHLGATLGGVDANVQWELGLYQNNPVAGGCTPDIEGNRYADLTWYDHKDPTSTLQLYELKGTWNPCFADRALQRDEYISLLRPVVNTGVAPGTVLSGWTDLFLVNTGIACGDGSLVLYKVYIGWQSAPGLFDIFGYQPPCFDPRTVPVPKPVPVDVPVGVTLPDLPPEYWNPPVMFPGHPWPVPGTPPVVVPPPVLVPPVWPNPPIPKPTPPPGGGPDIEWPCMLTPSCAWQRLKDDWEWFKQWVEDNFGGQYGDPHIVTIDGLHYDFQAAGEFDAVVADAYGMDVQVRLVPVGTRWSAVTAVAFDLDGHTVELDQASPYLYVDHAPYSLAVGSMLDFGDGAFLVHQNEGYYAAWPGDGARPALWYGSRQLRVYMPPGNRVSGLLGNADGDPSNDLANAFGTSLPASASQTAILGTYADSWRITQDRSFFTYGDGQSTDTFTDRSFPTSVLKISDLSDAALAEATGQCANAGVVDGPQFDDCVIDWALTQDANFLADATTQLKPIVEGGAGHVDASGVVTQDFDTTVAPNFSSPRYGAGAGTNTFAGPFGHNGRYVFYVPDLPGHSSATIQFDVIVLGDWTTNAASNTVSVDVGGATVWTGAVATGAPTATGTLPTGEPYAVYPVSVTAANGDKQLNVGISAPIAIASSRAFGVDNVRLSLALVSPQSFDVTLPAAVSNGVPADGAGNLETLGSEDDYVFSLPADGALQLDLSGCGSSLGYALDYKLVNVQSGATVVSATACGSRLVPGLSAGRYELVVTRNGKSGTYSLGMLVAPPPQAFDVTLPVSVANGVPAAGAGNLETTASEDDYLFSLATDGSVQLDFSGCGSSLGYGLDYKLVNAQTAATVVSATACGSRLVSSLSAGQYELVVTRNGKTGTYALGISVVPAPEVFDVTLPASISNGVPAAGAGNLETTSSEDDYLFSLSADGALQLDFSGCGSSLGYGLDYKLLNAQTGATLVSTTACSSRLVSGLSAGLYELLITRNGKSGTYSVSMLVQPPPQSFSISLPASVSNGVPGAGAGNLETTASEDDYLFTLPADGALQLDFSGCGSSLGYGLDYKLLNAQTGATVVSTTACGSKLVSGLGAGQYELVVTRNGKTGTYAVALSAVAAPQAFSVSLPASISNGVPAAGAGNLETTASEDDYLFSLAADGALQLDFSGCGSSLGYGVDYKLVNTQSGTTILSTTACSSRLVSGLSAGQYELVVTRNGKSGTYSVSMLVQPPPQSFSISLPANISNGVPGAGAGNLETTASEDDYLFALPQDGSLQLDFSGCGSSLGYGVDYKLLNAQTGATVVSATACSSRLVSGLGAGQYELIVTRNGKTGTYAVALSAVAGPQVFDVSLPAGISNGVPAAGAGNLETTASEDDYVFSLAGDGALQLDFSGCGSSLGYAVDYKLLNVQSGATVLSATACSSRLVSGLSAGQYELVVTRNGKSGTYSVGMLVQPPPQVFGVSLPASIANNVPGAGAGNLETTASEDDYLFTLPTDGALQLDFSGCGSSLGYAVDYKLLNAQSGATVVSATACSSRLVSGLSAGQYELVVTRNGKTGTYAVGMLVQPPPDVFNISVPASIANGVPAAGAGNLETTASEDDYVLTLAADGALQLDFSGCGSSLGYAVDYKLLNAQTGATVVSATACSSRLVSGLGAGQYKLAVTRNGKTGTYSVGILVQPPAEVFSVTLPANISNGVPAAGAGNLETTASEDDYRFTTGALGTLQLAFSGCGSSLGYAVDYKLVNEQTGATASSGTACSTKSISALAAGAYRVVVTRNGKVGTYALGISLGP